MEGQRYWVGQESFCNYFNAVRKSAEVKQFASAHIPQWHIDAWQSVDVPFVLSKSAEHWIDEKIKYIYESTHTQRLEYSGGTDSHTILVRAKQLGIKFSEIWMFTSAMQEKDFEWCEAEIIPGIDYIKQNTNLAHNIVIQKPTIEHYESWLDPEFPYRSPGMHMGFRPTCRDRLLSNSPRMDAHISGNAKPILFTKNNHWYMIWLTGNERSSYLHGTHYFFSDGYFPQVAISQAYRAKQWVETNVPQHQGWFGQLSVPVDRRGDYQNALGMVPALNKHIQQGNYYGKGCKGGPHNRKHEFAMRQIAELGRLDILEAYQNRCEEVCNTLENIEHGIKIYKVDNPFKQYSGNLHPTLRIPEPVERICTVLEMHPDRVEQVSPEVLSLD